MKLSESLRRGIMKVVSGGILNRLRIKRRRTTLFFEDILSEYLLLCERAGYGDKMEEIGKKWGYLGTKQLGSLRVFHNITLLNTTMSDVWRTMGLLDAFTLKKNDDILLIETENEFITRRIGKNNFMIGLFKGCLSYYFESDVDFIKTEYADDCTLVYTFKLTKNKYVLYGKDKEVYNKLNELPTDEGFTLKNALKSNIVILKNGNRIYFRNKYLLPIENTVFHIIGNENILMDRVPEIAHKFFKDTIKKSPATKKLLLLKMLLQIMGWGKVRMFSRQNELVMHIENLPIGLQNEKDNWLFLVKVINGYLWTIDKKYHLKEMSSKRCKLNVIFSKS